VTSKWVEEPQPFSFAAWVPRRGLRKAVALTCGRAIPLSGMGDNSTRPEIWRGRLPATQFGDLCPHAVADQTVGRLSGRLRKSPLGLAGPARRSRVVSGFPHARQNQV